MYPFVKYKQWSFFPWPCLQKNAEKHFEKMKNFTAREDDILLCTAQKAGTLAIFTNKYIYGYIFDYCTQ